MVFETLLHSDLKEGVRVKQLTGNLFSGDNGGNRITVEIMDNGQPATVSGGVTGYVIREDKKTVVISNGTLSGNCASIVLPASAYTVIGQVSIVIKVGTTTVGACTAYVYRSTTDAIVDPGHEVPSIDELLTYIEDCIAATAGANSATLAASSATASANSAASSATQAASSASSAATAANTATGAANSAATSANTAALAAQSATSAATAAAGAVNSAILAASSATAHAETATLAATSAAEKAEEAAELVASMIDDTKGIGDTDYVWSADQNEKLYDIQDGRTNELYGYVNYGYDQHFKFEPGSYASTNITAIRNKTEVYLNGSPTGSYLYFKLNNTPARATSTSGLDGWETPSYFQPGHKYRITVKRISGSCTYDGDPYMPIVAIYKQGTHTNPISTVVYLDGDVSISEFVGNDQPCQVVLMRIIGRVFTNLRCSIDMQDLDSLSIYNKLDKIDKTIDVKSNSIDVTSNIDAPVATFEDGADDMPMEVTVGIDASQDLNGYDYPWAGGNGKNLFLGWNDTSAGSASWYSKDLPVDMNTNTYYMVSGLDDSHNIMIRAYDSNNTMLGRTTGAARTTIKLSKNSFTTEQASGADFDTISYIRLNYYSWTGITKEALDAIPIQVEIGETATEYEPYENICPITGHTGTNIIRTGKNLCPIILTDTAVKYGYSATPQADGSVVVQGTWTGSSNNVLIKNSSDEDVFVSYRLPAGSYVLTGANSDYYENYGITLQVYNSTDGIQTGREYGDGMSFTFDSEKLVVVRIYIVSSKATNAIPSGGVKLYPMIRLATESDDTYEPFGTTYSITFPSNIGNEGVVYGGTLTVNKDGTGKLVVTHSLSDLSSWTWYYVGSKYFRAGSSSTSSGSKIKRVAQGQTLGQAYCNNYKIVNVSSLDALTQNGTISVGNNITVYGFIIVDNRFTDATSFKAALEAEDAQVCYEYTDEARLTYSLSAEQIRTLFSINTIFCDTGNILSINYPADTKTYIDNQNADSMIADGEASMVATRNYSAGEMFTVKSKLYKTTSAVASGEALVTGTGGNCTETTVADEISAILNSSATGVSF